SPPGIFNFLGFVARIPGGVFELAQTMRFRPLRQLPIAFGWLTKRPLEREISDSHGRPWISDKDIRRDAGKFIKGFQPETLQTAASKLRTFDRPVLITWAADDRFFKLDLGKRLAAAFPNARFEVIDDSRTFVPED